ncbi:MAG TPA: hypothetical protein PLO37_17455 [Candidatus Hydrogenedentes bacterium]|nr:hypothetical protein [Candidatus Hydrogenedentota bacterium]HPG68635.1 hypothetical protein [Candidatus Hydrogenedentota bacterium]
MRIRFETSIPMAFRARCAAIAVCAAVVGAVAYAQEVYWSTAGPLNSYAVSDNGATPNNAETFPYVATDDAGTWVTVWKSNINLGGTIGTDYDILVSRSTDNGLSWSAAKALNSNAAGDTSEDDRPQVATDSAGLWMAVWTSEDPLGGALGSDFDLLFARSVDGGATWSSAQALNTNAATDSGDDRYPQIVTDGQGHWLVVWFSYDSLNGTIGIDTDILAARSSDAGATWTSPQPVNHYATTDTSYDAYPKVTTDAQGHWLAIWTSDDTLGDTIGSDTDVMGATSSDNGYSWSNAFAVNTNAATDSGSDSVNQVATNGLGHWLALWVSTDTLGNTIGDDCDILAARSRNNGVTWNAPVAVNSYATSDTDHEFAPQLAIDGLGNWICAWYTGYIMGPIGADYDILSACSITNGAFWSSAQALNSFAATDTGSDYYPTIAADSRGNFVTVWCSKSPQGTYGTDSDLMVERGGAGTLTLTIPNGGEVWDVATDHAITWRGYNPVVGSELNIGLLKGGVFIDWVARRATNNGYLVWTVPAGLEPGDDYSLRIQSAAIPTIEDSSDAPFSIRGEALVLTAPNGGETWTTGDIESITWDSEGLIAGADVRVGLHKGSTFWGWITLKTANDGRHNWIVPLDMEESTAYKIRVQSYTISEIRDYSDAPFSMVRAPLLVTSPVRLEAWPRGSTRSIEWQSNSPAVGSHVRIALQKGGEFLFWVHRHTPNDGIHPWTLPSDLAPASNYKIRVQSYDNSDLRDFSPKFSITQAE